MNKNLNHKGASKRKGAAESKELTEDGPAIDVADKGMAKKKGAAQIGYDAVIQYGKDLKKARDKANEESLNNRFNAGILDSINLEHSNKGDEAIKTYGKNYGQISNPSGEDKKAKYLGEKDFVEPSAEALKSYMNTTMDEIKGSSRMGFTQNFGAARQNGYAKGAAKVASIMNFGAAKYGGNKGDESKSNRDYEK